jgi:hypothetical protein
VTIAKRPSGGSGMDGSYAGFLFLKSRIFFFAGLDTSGKSDVTAPARRYIDHGIKIDIDLIEVGRLDVHGNNPAVR